VLGEGRAQVEGRGVDDMAPLFNRLSIAIWPRFKAAVQAQMGLYLSIHPGNPTQTGHDATYVRPATAYGARCRQ
jgi:hypothetical protein